MEKQSRLLRPKEWLTVAEAAERLAQDVGTDVSEADIFQNALAQTRRLTLSSRFPTPVDAVELTKESWQRIVAGDRDFDATEVLLDFSFTLPDGVYDLPMVGSERYDVEHEYQKRTGGPEVRAPAQSRPTDGPFVVSPAP